MGGGDGWGGVGGSGGEEMGQLHLNKNFKKFKKRNVIKNPKMPITRVSKIVKYLEEQC